MKRILSVLIVAILFITPLGSAVAETIYEAGYILLDATSGYPRVAYGTAATIVISTQSTPLPGDTVAFWTSLDQSWDCICPENGQHWWAQAGYVIGLAPNGVTYTQPEMYIETNGDSYSFQPIASADWGTLHTFQVWVSPTTGAANSS